ncbi:ATPase [Solibacillus sp. NPDC093137]|uniref:ATPase n=1 Tax=Solibacillus sp. NPDC093137 TaxID=3390678 RepID=UPI003D020A65
MVELDFSIVLAFILIMVLITPLVLSIYYRKKPKVDKGLKFAYHGLSYRRKFLRNLYSIPICIVALAIIYWVEGFTNLFIFFSLFFIVLFGIQTSYNYIKWKKEED